MNDTTRKIGSAIGITLTGGDPRRPLPVPQPNAVDRLPADAVEFVRSTTTNPPSPKSSPRA